MNEILLLLDEYLAQNKKLIDFIGKMQGDNIKFYRDNQEILYVGIVNRTYSLWETFCKDIVFEYYQRIKDQLQEKGELVRKLKLNELPGYIVEQGTITGNRISYEIKKEYITYTSKNIGFDELKKLFSRFDVNVEELQVNKVIRKFLEENSYCFGIDDFTKEYLKKAMENLTDERNVVSHYSSIEEYKELSIIVTWVQFCQIIARELTNIIICLLIEKIDTKPRKLGDFVMYLNKGPILCIDVSTDAYADANSIIYTKRNNKVKNVYRPKNFKVDDEKVEAISEGDKAGILLDSLVENFKTIDKKDEIYVLSSY